MARRAVAIAACGAILAAFGGCGGDDSSKQSNTVTTESTPADTQTESTPTSTPAQTPTATTPSLPPRTTTAPSSKGGATVPADPAKPDSPGNDTSPPAGSPADKYEQQCKANPQTCGD